MDAQGINVLDETHRNHVPFCIPNHFQLQLLPAQNGFLHQNLSHQRSLQPSCADRPQLVLVVHQTAAGASHGIGRAQNHRVAQLVRNLQPILHGVGHLTSGHLNAQLVHGLLEFDPVLAPFDGIHLHSNDLHLIFLQNACPGQLRAEIQPRLSSQIGQQRIRAFLGYDLLQTFLI